VVKRKKLERTKLWHEAYVNKAKRIVKFCNKCGEYWTLDDICSNPWCPEEMA